MSEKSNESIQLDEFFAMFENIERRLSRLENSFDIHRRAVDTMSDNVFSMYKRISALEEYRLTNQENTAFFCDRLKEIHEKIDDIETDIDLLYAMTHNCDNFCGNCAHCKQYPDGLYKCEITACEIDPDTSSCIRFKHPFDKSDAEICKVCSDKDTPRCYKCSYFPF